MKGKATDRGRKNPNDSKATKTDIKMIARAAGVSISTVSRVVNHSKPVSDELTLRVMEVINRENYVPSFSARSLVKQRTSTIGIVVPVISPEFHTRILSGADEYLYGQGYETLICPIRDDTKGEARYLDLIARRVTDGLLLMHESGDSRVRTALLNAGVPIVLCSVHFGDLGLPAVGIDDYTAAQEATLHLISLGHRRIGFISLAERSTSGSHRIRGYTDALQANGIQPSSQHVTFAHYALESGYRAAASLMSRDPEITAIFAASDEMAVGALRFLTETGRAVPGDVSIVGFDNVQIATYSNPPLTTVHQPIREIGLRSAKLLISLIRGEVIPARRINLPHRLIVRESTAPPGKTT